ncbi:SH3 domain-containing protein [Rhodohalobacter halophilus]|uniref:SH3 domain-containing protein n=1 Tax=Rhodohalobacter halophilus TaxID=1812810 RepID=UPI00083F94A5|nr:SH3 domain-containing protein [Rhodohalobacter halophilus]
MRRLTVALLFLLFPTSFEALHAQQTAFNEATELLEQQEFRQAIDQYIEIEKEGHQSGALWYNMGIAYSQLDSLGMAKYYFLRSSNYKETKSDALQAVQTINERFSRRSAVLPPLPWERFFTFLDEQVGTSALHILGFVFLYSAVVLILISWYLKKNQNLYRYLMYACMGLALVHFASAFYITYLDNRYDTGVVTDRQSRVYQSPNSTSAEVSIAYEGYILRVDKHQSESRDEWLYIRLENGMTGWIPSPSVRVIP